MRHPGQCSDCSTRDLCGRVGVCWPEGSDGADVVATVRRWAANPAAETCAQEPPIRFCACLPGCGPIDETTQTAHCATCGCLMLAASLGELARAGRLAEATALANLANRLHP